MGGIGDMAKGLRDQADDLAEQHDDTIKQGIDQGADKAGDTFGHRDRIDQGAEKAKGVVDDLAEPDEPRR